MNSAFIVTTSWDDGHPSDLRVAELLARHGLSGTFYVPSRNVEGRPVMSQAEVRALGEGFEIGGHSRDHEVLTAMPQAELTEQVVANKQWLEDTLGREIRGFCYVRGKYNQRVTAAVYQAGYSYARTVRGLCCAEGFAPFDMPTTLQFYPHSPSVYLRNYVRAPCADLGLLGAAMGNSDLVQRVASSLRVAQERGRFFHLWGHSWELDEHDLWGSLDEALALIAQAAENASNISNDQVAIRLSRSR